MLNNLVTIFQTLLFILNLEILPLYSQYTLSLLLFMIEIKINLWSILR